MWRTDVTRTRQEQAMAGTGTPGRPVSCQVRRDDGQAPLACRQCGIVDGMTDLKLFQFHDESIRVVTIDGAPWWVLNDVCVAIGISAPHRAATRLDSEDLRSTQVLDSNGHRQENTIVNESGLYDLIFVSRKPAAREFKRWITSQVIPSIRKTGMYVSEIDLPRALRQYADAVEEKMRAESRAITAETYIQETRPAVTEWQTYMDSSGLCDLGSLAQALGGGRQRLVDRLRELDMLVKKNASQLDGTRPMQTYKDFGWFDVRMETTPVGNVAVTYATPKGVSGILRALVKYGVGDRTWSALPAEDDLFSKLAFQGDTAEESAQ